MGIASEVEKLASIWRARANQLQQWGAGQDLARAWELAAVELEHALREQQEGTLNLREASGESGYSADHLGQLVRDGKIPNAGRPNAPLIRRADLPIKPGPRRKISGTGEITADDLQ